MWYYKSKIGILYIKQRANGRYGLYFEDEYFGNYASPRAAADNVRSFCTDCYDWDKHESDPCFPYPTDLSEWDRC